MRRFDTVLFDLDGTLLDTLEDICGAANHTLRELGYPERTLAEMRRFVGQRRGDADAPRPRRRRGRGDRREGARALQALLRRALPDQDEALLRAFWS